MLVVLRIEWAKKLRCRFAANWIRSGESYPDDEGGVVDLRAQLLSWILEESDSGEGATAVPIHLLLVKAALSRQGELASSTASTEISLQMFERASICRSLRELVTAGEIAFVDKQGVPVEADERELTAFADGAPSKVKYVRVVKGPQ